MRSGYTDEIDGPELALYRGQVASAIRGKRGQRLLRDALAALDAMPAKRLIAHELVDGADVCLLGAAGKLRGISDLHRIDPEAHSRLASLFDVSPCLIAEIEYENDEGNWQSETPEQRYERVRRWLVKQIIPVTSTK